METLFIYDEEKHSIVDLENENISGYSFFNDGRIEPINSSVLNVFNSFFLSNNRTELPSEGKYKVILDNETGFKHYFDGDSEDFLMFFDKNGEDVTAYSQVINSKLKEQHIFDRENYTVKARAFKVGKTLVKATATGLVGAMLFLAMLNTAHVALNPEEIKDYTQQPIGRIITDIRGYTADDVINKILLSPNLSNEDKKFLCNRDLFDDLLPYINQDSEAKYLLERKLDNLTIKTYDNTGMRSNGFYSTGELNALYIAESSVLDYYYDIISHEFMHLLQKNYYYNVISEACAEIVSQEFFDEALPYSYHEEVKEVKKLMEVIGPVPILKYICADDFAAIEREVIPYFSQEELDEFRAVLHMKSCDDPDYTDEENHIQMVKLDHLICELFERKFGYPAIEDDVMQGINTDSVGRCYFNSKKQNGQYNYMIHRVDSHITLEQACNYTIVNMYQQYDTFRVPVSYEDFMNGNYDYNTKLEFGVNSFCPVSIVCEDDNQLHVYVHGEEHWAMEPVNATIEHRAARHK